MGGGIGSETMRRSLVGRNAHAFPAPNRIRRVAHREDTSAFTGVEQVEEASELWASGLHRVQHRLPRDFVEAIPEVSLENQEFRHEWVVNQDGFT